MKYSLRILRLVFWSRTFVLGSGREGAGWLGKLPSNSYEDVLYKDGVAHFLGVRKF